MALWTNARLVEATEGQYIAVPMREVLESDENGIITCKYTPAHSTYVYKKETGEKLEFTQDENKLTISEPYIDVIVDYDFDYENGGQLIKIGQRLLNGFVELEGITRVKDDTTGHVVTGILKIPRLKLMSNLSIRLGKNAVPMVGTFTGTATPVGSRGSTYITEFCILSDDIDSDL
jgi:hypothetical protein